MFEQSKIDLEKTEVISVKKVSDLPSEVNPDAVYKVESTGQQFIWVDDWVQLYDPDMTRIVCAANKYPSGLVVAGIRHYDRLMIDCLRRVSRVNPETECIQGFMDNKGIFHNRKNAWNIALKAGQIIRRVGGDIDSEGHGVLYSENLY